MTTKTANQHNPEHLEDQAATLARQLADARARAEKARANLDTARERALTDFWQNRITAFYDQVRPQVAQAWHEFTRAVTGATEDDTLTAWRTYAKARARARAEHKLIKREATRRSLGGVRPMLALPNGGYTECITLVLNEWEEAHHPAYADQLATTAKQAGEAAEDQARTQGKVPDAQKIVARFKLGPTGVTRDLGTYPVVLRNPGDGREVYFRDGRYDALDADTAELIRQHARTKKIREINANGKVINDFGNKFTSRP
ncbi:hypothetical protein [Nocardiopsis nanhaiensis]